jgi:toxin HigB-1
MARLSVFVASRQSRASGDAFMPIFMVIPWWTRRNLACYIDCAAAGGVEALIESFRHRGLKELFETGRSGRVDPRLIQRCADVLDALDVANSLNDLNLPGFQLHTLQGKPVRHSIHVNGPRCITFEWDAPRAYKVDLEQYH